MVPSTKFGLGGAVALCLAIGCGGSSSSQGGTGGKGGSAGSSGTTGGSGGTTGGSGGTMGGSGGTTGGSSGTGGKATGGTSGSGGAGGSGGSSGGAGGSGGSGGGVIITDECPDYAPCGGDIVGSWRVTSICGDLAPAEELSPCEGTTPTQTLDINGVYTFNADGTATVEGTAHGTFDIEVSDECAAEGGATTAEQFCVLFELLAAGGLGMDAGGMGEALPIEVDCNYADGVCVCHAEQDVVLDETSTYEVSGNEITITDAEGAVTEADFCIDGDELMLHEISEGSIVTATRE